jgi:hypothetical protein
MLGLFLDARLFQLWTSCLANIVGIVLVACVLELYALFITISV